jgi:hypothetical protein
MGARTNSLTQSPYTQEQSVELRQEVGWGRLWEVV